MEQAGATPAPERLRWAAELLAPEPSDALLEIGCGRGVAGVLLSELLPTGCIVGIDRSKKAIDAARLANAAAAAEGRASFVLMAFEEGMPAGHEFDRVLAVNVNRFWQTQADESALWKEILKQNAKVVLIYESPPGTSAERMIAGGRRYLARSGFDEVVVSIHPERTNLAAIIARWPHPGPPR